MGIGKGAGRGLPKGKTNNPQGNPRGSRNAKMTSREERALDAENTGSTASRVAAIKGRVTGSGGR